MEVRPTEKKISQKVEWDGDWVTFERGEEFAFGKFAC